MRSEVEKTNTQVRSENRIPHRANQPPHVPNGKPRDRGGRNRGERERARQAVATELWEIKFTLAVKSKETKILAVIL